MCSFTSHGLPPPNLVHAQYAKYKHPNHSNHGQCTYLIQPQQQSIKSQCWRLLLVVSVHVAHAQNSFYHLRTVVTHIANIWFASSWNISGVSLQHIE